MFLEPTVLHQSLYSIIVSCYSNETKIGSISLDKKRERVRVCQFISLAGRNYIRRPICLSTEGTMCFDT